MKRIRERTIAKCNWEVIFRRIEHSIREIAKTTRASLYYFENGKRFREDPDGQKYVLIIESDDTLSEYLMSESKNERYKYELFKNNS